MKKRVKNIFPVFLFGILFIAGLVVMAYPMISNAFSEAGYDRVIAKYQDTVNTKNKEEYIKMLESANEYNKKLTMSSIIDAFSDIEIQNTSDYKNILNIDNEGTMGYISIPKIDVKIPIYHGTGAKVLQKGVGHLEGSSIPVGGETTHGVLSAHRGLPSARLFTDLDQMEKGDKFYIYILDQVLTYEVDQILVIDPSNTEPLRLEEGKDYVTLVTCTPYAVNTHRLLVRGSRVIEKEETEVREEETATKKMGFSELIIYIGIGIGIIIFIVTIIIVEKMKKKHKHLKKEDQIEMI